MTITERYGLLVTDHEPGLHVERDGSLLVCTDRREPLGRLHHHPSGWWPICARCGQTGSPADMRMDAVHLLAEHWRHEHQVPVFVDVELEFIGIEPESIPDSEGGGR